MGRRWSRELLGAMAAACLMAGCTPSSSEPAASPAPPTSAAATPRETALERQQREDFEEAEAQYRKFMAEYDRLAKTGGATSASKVMRETATGKYLLFYEAVLQRQKSKGYTYTAGTRLTVQRGSYSSTQLTLEVCEDASLNRVFDRSGKQVDTGRILQRSLYARSVRGVWKIWNGDDRGEQTSCD